jgi:hypothetical protein
MFSSRHFVRSDSRSQITWRRILYSLTQPTYFIDLTTIESMSLDKRPSAWRRLRGRRSAGHCTVKNPQMQAKHLRELSNMLKSQA